MAVPAAGAGAGGAGSPALGAAGRAGAAGLPLDEERLKQALVGLLGVLGLLLVLLAIPLVALRTLEGGGAEGYPRGSGIPRVYWPIYAAAAAHYRVNAYLLASIHRQESDFGRSPLPGIRSGVNGYGCCAGPMQFNLSDGSWSAHRFAFRAIGSARPAAYPLRRSGLASCRGVPAHTGCVYDSFDAIAGAAHKLRGQGADRSLDSPGTMRAVCGYIGACSAVTSCGGPNAYCQVLPRARAWERMGTRAIDGAALLPYAGGGRLGWPTPASYRSITSPFGPRWGRLHAGIDIAAPLGAPLAATRAGRVTLVCRNVSPCSGYGNFLCLQHTPRLSSCYAHLSRFGGRIRLGAPVVRGQLVGYVGCTGHCLGAHLHFEVRLGRYPAQAVDPLPYLGARGR